jgi:hypothetical protein
MTPKRIICLAAVVGAVALGGCAQQRPLHAVNGYGAGVSAAYSGPITKPVTMAGVGFAEAVPSASDVQDTAVTASAAFAKCSVAGSTCLSDPNVTASVTLARVTSTVVTPDQLQNRLVYVLRWDGFTCSGKGPTPVTIDSCTQLVFIDAQTGENLGATISGTAAFDPGVVPNNPPGTPGEKPRRPGP